MMSSCKDGDCGTCASCKAKSTKGKSAKHPGFAAVQNKIASKEGLSKKAAGAILAARSRGASASAHKANPRLNRVKG